MLNLFQHLVKQTLKQVQGDGWFTGRTILKKISM